LSVDYYNKNANKFFKDTYRLDMSEIYIKFINYIPKKGKILDAGCGSGRDTKAFSDLGFEVVAFDASIEMVNLARIYTNQKVLNITFDDVKWENEFDGIWACASLLHITEDEFKSCGTKIYNSLKEDRPFYLSFKYGYRDYLKDDRFFQCHDEDSLNNLMQSLGSFSEKFLWITTDIRAYREEEKWLNAIFIK